MGEALTVVVVMAVGLVFAVVFFMRFRPSKWMVALEARVAELRPSQTLAEAVIAPGAPVELRARAIRGAHRIWLASEVVSGNPTGRWSATATISYRAAPEEAGYRADTAMVEERFAVGYDGEGGVTSPKAKGILCIPEGMGRQTLQLLSLPSCPEGTELFVRVALDALTDVTTGTFRAFIGVSTA